MTKSFLPIVFKSGTSVPSCILLGSNDLGMQCYNRDLQDLAVLPPFNTLWAQVIMRGDLPQIVSRKAKAVYTVKPAMIVRTPLHQAVRRMMA